MFRKKVLVALVCLIYSCAGDKYCDSNVVDEKLEIEFCLQKGWTHGHSGFNDNFFINNGDLTTEVFGHALTDDEINLTEPVKQTWAIWFGLSGCVPGKQEGLTIDANEAWMGTGQYEDTKSNQKMCQTVAYVRKNNRAYFIQCRSTTNNSKANWNMVKHVSESIHFINQ
jgi:hypothetical protein